MTGLGFAIEDTAVKEVMWQDIVAKYDAPGIRELYAVHLGATGLISARILLLFLPENSRRLVSALMGEEVELPLDDVGLSALGEVGNVVGTAFLNVFANIFGQIFEPTVPEVRHALGSRVLPPFPLRQKVLITEAVFRVTGEELTAEILIAPLKKGDVWS
jgi:chemotaxis protein CheC